jgi:glutaconate CoA-transferase subunit B
MRLEAPHPGAKVEEVHERTGFEMLIPDEIRHTDPPNEQELRILRELDPDQRYTRAKEE